jgi:hypothetical protein
MMALTWTHHRWPRYSDVAAQLPKSPRETAPRHLRTSAPTVHQRSVNGTRHSSASPPCMSREQNEVSVCLLIGSKRHAPGQLPKRRQSPLVYWTIAELDFARGL